MMFLAIYPYVVLLIFLITGCTKEGAWTGIKFFITPQWHKIYDPNVRNNCYKHFSKNGKLKMNTNQHQPGTKCSYRHVKSNG